MQVDLLGQTDNMHRVIRAQALQLADLVTQAGVLFLEDAVLLLEVVQLPSLLVQVRTELFVLLLKVFYLVV